MIGGMVVGIVSFGWCRAPFTNLALGVPHHACPDEEVEQLQRLAAAVLLERPADDPLPEPVVLQACWLVVCPKKQVRRETPTAAIPSHHHDTTTKNTHRRAGCRGTGAPRGRRRPRPRWACRSPSNGASPGGTPPCAPPICGGLFRVLCMCVCGCVGGCLWGVVSRFMNVCVCVDALADVCGFVSRFMYVCICGCVDGCTYTYKLPNYTCDVPTRSSWHSSFGLDWVWGWADASVGRLRSPPIHVPPHNHNHKKPSLLWSPPIHISPHNHNHTHKSAHVPPPRGATPPP